MDFKSKLKVANTNCCVYECHSRAGKKKGISFHAFPRKGERKVKLPNKYGETELVDKRAAWIKQIRTGKAVTSYMKICSLHFKKEDYILPDVPCQRRTLKRTAVPTCNLPRQEVVNERRVPRKRLIEPEATTSRNDEIRDTTEDFEPVKHCANDIECAKTLLDLASVKNTYVDIGVQVTSGDIIQRFVDLIDSDQKLNTLTGLPNFKVLNQLTQLYNRCYPNIKILKLSTKEKIILTFMKMKLNITYAVLAVLFKYVTRVTCKNVFCDTVDKLHNILKLCIYWPSKEECTKNMPICFKDFSNVRVVLDCTEIPMQQPKCLCCRLKSYSHYKSHNTIKFLTGVSPAGTITFISKAYGGRASDKAIFEQSNLIEKLKNYEDAIMIDKGFRIDEIAGSYGIKLTRPPFLKQQMQLSKEQADMNCKIARARVHIERVFQRVKIFKILNTPLAWHILPLIDKIFIIACGITNLSSPVLNDDKFLK